VDTGIAPFAATTIRFSATPAAASFIPGKRKFSTRKMATAAIAP
jgi:hypothetical protein